MLLFQFYTQKNKYTYIFLTYVSHLKFIFFSRIFHTRPKNPATSVGSFRTTTMGGSCSEGLMS